MTPRRPLVGITCNYEPNKEYPGRKDACNQQVGYFLALDGAGALPVLIPAVEDREKLAEYLERLDGIVFSGAMDIPPDRYGSPAHPRTDRMSEQRIRFEWPLAQLALASPMPILGICGGLQMLSTVTGGTLFQHVPDRYGDKIVHSSGKPEDARHEVNVEPGSRIAAMLAARARVNSAHHQAVDKLGEGFIISARADDGVIEAIERPGERFVVALQWHPERCMDLPGQKEIFAAFVSACREQERDK